MRPKRFTLRNVGSGVPVRAREYRDRGDSEGHQRFFHAAPSPEASGNRSGSGAGGNVGTPQARVAFPSNHNRAAKCPRAACWNKWPKLANPRSRPEFGFDLFIHCFSVICAWRRRWESNPRMTVLQTAKTLDFSRIPRITYWQPIG